MGRVVVAGIVGGIVMFIWGAVSHMLLPTGDLGVGSLPNEEIILPAMKTAITKRGFYRFPGMSDQEMSEAEIKGWEEKYRKGPRGIVIYDPSGGEPMSATQLGTELASNIAAALLAAAILAQVPGGRGKRILCAMLLGILAWLSIDVSYWNWDRFPDMFLLNALIDQGAGWLFTGMAIALVLGKPKAELSVQGWA